MEKQGLVVRMAGEMEEGARRTPKHVERGAHGVRVVAQRADAMLVGHACTRGREEEMDIRFYDFRTSCLNKVF